MAILINNFQIINNGSDLAIEVETGVGFLITSILLWDMLSFKDYSLSTNLTYKTTNINNKEVFIVNARELGLLKFEDIYFIEIETNQPAVECQTCLTPALGITYNILPYYKCMLNSLIESGINDCVTCNDLHSKNLLVTINLLIDSIEKSIDLGFYSQAIDNLKKLKKLCNLEKCTNCLPIECHSCSKFKQEESS